MDSEFLKFLFQSKIDKVAEEHASPTLAGTFDLLKPPLTVQFVDEANSPCLRFGCFVFQWFDFHFYISHLLLKCGSNLKFLA